MSARFFAAVVVVGVEAESEEDLAHVVDAFSDKQTAVPLDNLGIIDSKVVTFTLSFAENGGVLEPGDLGTITLLVEDGAIRQSVDWVLFESHGCTPNFFERAVNANPNASVLTFSLDWRLVEDLFKPVEFGTIECSVCEI